MESIQKSSPGRWDSIDKGARARSQRKPDIAGTGAQRVVWYFSVAREEKELEMVERPRETIP